MKMWMPQLRLITALLPGALDIEDFSFIKPLLIQKRLRASHAVLQIAFKF